MSSSRFRLRRASFSLNLPKHDVYKTAARSRGFHEISSSASNLTPDIQVPTSTPLLLDPATVGANFVRVGNYLVSGEVKDTANSQASLSIRDAVNVITEEQLTCKVLPLNRYQEVLAPYFRLGSHDGVVQLHEVIIGATCVYAFFARHYGDLHSHVRAARRLRDTDAARLFEQIVSVVAHCHESGIVLRDLKLRKFVFKDPEKTQLMLESLDDARVLDTDLDDDFMSDRHGCPAYVSPEILAASDSTYSGRAADVWSLGVILYTMLIGRYPFYDSDPISLFRMIRNGRFAIPKRAVSEQAECLVRWLLCCDPSRRPSASEVLHHPWFDLCRRSPSQANRYYLEKLDRGSSNGKDADVEHNIARSMNSDQTVPQGTSTKGSINDFNLDW